jgi:diacylglycerol kinase family enzyme
VTLGTPLGVLPLGTGNGWAHAMGAPQWRAALGDLGRVVGRDGPLPLKRFDLVEVLGTIAHFAGTGWDAEIIDDFFAQRKGPGLLPQSARHGLRGYLHGMFTRTIPRHVFMREMVQVELTNTGSDALVVNEHGHIVPLRGGEHGKVLYRGPVSVCAAGTSPEWGFGFRAFPFAGMVPRRFCMRVYAGGPIEATFRMRSLWRGAHPVDKMHTWLLDRCSAAFSRPVPFQVGGDRLGHRTDVEYALAPEQIDILDWRALRAA